MELKIAFLTPEYPHDRVRNSGGIGTSIKNLAKGLVNEGVKVTLLIYGQNEDCNFQEGGITYYLIKNVRIKGVSWFFTRKKIQNKINQLYQSKDVNVVEAPDWTGITSFINTKCPISIRLHGSDTYFCSIEDRPKKWFNTYLEKKSLKRANIHISVSEFTAQKTNEIFRLNIPFKIIHNGIDPFVFKPYGIAKDKKGKKKILYLGTLIRKKGLLELPYIFNKLIEKNQNVELVLIGSDSNDIKSGSNSTFALMKPLFSSRALKKVNYLGKIPYKDVVNYIAEASVCVFPSFAEAFPVSWLEAMAMEKATVASNIGWSKEVVNDGENGYLVHPTDHELYASKINELLLDDEIATKIGVNAREKVLKEFSIEVITKLNIEFYKSVL